MVAQVALLVYVSWCSAATVPTTLLAASPLSCLGELPRLHARSQLPQRALSVAMLSNSSTKSGCGVALALSV